MKVDVAGINIDNLSRLEALNQIREFLQTEQYHYVVTPYSEFFIFAEKDDNFKTSLNQADLALPDGSGVLWASKFLSLAVKAQSKTGRFFLISFQLFVSLLKTLLKPAYSRTLIPEQITGSSFIWNVAKLAEEDHYSLALVGGTNKVAEKTAEKLKNRFPNLNIKLAISDAPFDERQAKRIAESKSDILIIAYSPPHQELWLAQNRQKLGVKVAFGLGGTFDYISGKNPPAPVFLHSRGLEWTWRLIIQPWRVKRIWNAVPVFIWKIYQYKLKNYNDLYDKS